MDPNTTEIAHDFAPFLRIYKDGRVERLIGTATVPPSLDPITNVESKDVIYSPQNNLYCRLYKPQNTNQGQKLPLIVYIHGGGFCIETASSPTYHNYLNPLVSEAKIITVSVDYRRAPEDPLPAAYEDSWAALKWVASHVNGDGNEDWINNNVDFQKVFLAGDSAGANIVHNVGLKLGKEKLEGVNVVGLILMHPFFWGNEPVGNETRDVDARLKAAGIWHLACPTTSGCDDFWINPINDPDLKSLGCNKVLVCVAEKDTLTERGKVYCEKLASSGWVGSVEIMEAKGEDHVFHLFNPTCENSVALTEKLVSFINQERASST